MPARGHLVSIRQRFRTPPSTIVKILMRPPMVGRRKLVESSSTTEGLQLLFAVTISRGFFFCQYRFPGEQQKYGVALVEHLYSFLPEIATVVVLYDVGCVLDRSLELVSLSILYIYRACFNTYSVRHPAPQYHMPTSVCDLSNARIWPPMGMPTANSCMTLVYGPDLV
jgi:hypothetical protein